MGSTESGKKRISPQVFVLCIQMALLVALSIFEPSDDGIWFLYFIFLAAVIAASWIFVFRRILNNTFRQGSNADLVVGVMAIFLFYTIPAGISLLWLHHSLNRHDVTGHESRDLAAATISVFTESGEDRESMMQRLKVLNAFIGLVSAIDIAILLFFISISIPSYFNASHVMYNKIPIYFFPAVSGGLSFLDSYAVSRKLKVTAKLLPGKEGIVVGLKKEKYLYGYPVSSKVKIGRRKYLAGSTHGLMVNESVIVEKSVYVRGNSRVWLLLNVKPASG